MRGDQVTAPPAHTLPPGNQTPDARRWGGGGTIQVPGPRPRQSRGSGGDVNLLFLQKQEAAVLLAPPGPLALKTGWVGQEAGRGPG